MKKKYIWDLVVVFAIISFLGSLVFFVLNNSQEAKAKQTGRIEQGIYTDQKDIATAGNPDCLPDKEVPQDLELLIRAKINNSDSISLGGSTTTAAFSSGENFKLSPGESIQYNVDNALRVCIDANSNGDGVEITTI